MMQKFVEKYGTVDPEVFMNVLHPTFTDRQKKDETDKIHIRKEAARDATVSKHLANRRPEDIEDEQFNKDMTWPYCWGPGSTKHFESYPCKLDRYRTQFTNEADSRKQQMYFGRFMEWNQPPRARA